MKKIIALVAMMMTLAAASSAFATAGQFGFDFTKAGQKVTGDGKDLGKLSASVALAGANDATGYAIATMHQKGTKTFGTSHDSTAIFSYEGSAAAPTVSDSSSFGAGWTAM